MQLDFADLKGNAVAVVSDILNKLVRPSVLGTKEWGDLNKTQAGRQIRDDFMGDFNSFCSFIECKLIH